MRRARLAVNTGSHAPNIATRIPDRPLLTFAASTVGRVWCEPLVPGPVARTLDDAKTKAEGDHEQRRAALAPPAPAESCKPEIPPEPESRAAPTVSPAPAAPDPKPGWRPLMQFDLFEEWP
jgi:hypothetical protein